MTLYHCGFTHKPTRARIEALEEENTLLRSDLDSHTHDYNELTGTLPTHNHEYSDILNHPTTPSETELIDLIKLYSLGAPDYDSGWTGISPSFAHVFTHNLGTADILVYLVGRDDTVMTQHAYGGLIVATGGQMFRYGVFWIAEDEDTIRVERYIDDAVWEEVRVLIWELPPPPT